MGMVGSELAQDTRHATDKRGWDTPHIEYNILIVSMVCLVNSSNLKNI